MKKDEICDIVLYTDKVFDELYILESILKLTKESCQGQEFTSNYYNLPDKNVVLLSEERNNYINMLTLAIGIISKLKKIGLMLEKELPYLKQNSDNGGRHITA